MPDSNEHGESFCIGLESQFTVLLRATQLTL